VGTAFVLASTGAVKLNGPETRIVLGEKVGPVPVVIRATKGKPTFCQFTTAKLPEVGPPLPSNEILASCLSIDVEDMFDGAWLPQIVSCGLEFGFVRVKGRAVVARSRMNLERWEKHLANTLGQAIMIFATDAEEPGHDIHARMFAPGFGVPEDPATGSACAALGGYLGVRAPNDGTLRWVVEQGYEMGRPSLIEVEAARAGGKISAIRVGGASVMVCEGQITV
jgi:trans-2,3-dihydro-3-hydroxyanthranilate isomerase